ncbi:DUF6612 family protein [Halalkalibacter alkalisediminis]|uniref:DUF6612 family protein n=1 Tax=Halalkalibacter alkalisediminis TaxID=935616 RepID=A0ABV6NGC1_9BACI|nr:DUF6612 family protein [Halalkalibacter alkalisediminis]
MGNLKNWFVILCSFILLTACSEATSVESKDPAKETKEETQGELALEEILQKSIEAMEGIQSLSSEMNVVQEMALPNDESFSTNISVYMEITQDPFNMYQKMLMELPEVGNTEIEMYMVEDAVYYKDPMENKWFTYPDDLAQQLRDLETAQMGSEEQLTLLLENLEHLSYTEDDDHYIITVEGSADILQSFAQKLNGLVHDNMAGDIDQLMLMSDMKELDYILYIEKDTFLQTKMDMMMVFELQTDGESLLINTSTQATFSDFNAFTEVEVPANVIENAEEFDTSFSEFGDFDEFDEFTEEEESSE